MMSHAFQGSRAGAREQVDNVRYLPDSLDFSWEKLACETIMNP